MFSRTICEWIRGPQTFLNCKKQTIVCRCPADKCTFGCIYISLAAGRTLELSVSTHGPQATNYASQTFELGSVHKIASVKNPVYLAVPVCDDSDGRIAVVFQTNGRIWSERQCSLVDLTSFPIRLSRRSSRRAINNCRRLRGTETGLVYLTV